MAPAFSASRMLPPPNSVAPAEPTKPLTAATPATDDTPSIEAAAGPTKKPNATVVTIRPTVLLAKLLMALPILLKILLREKYSRRPVAGFRVPAPPRFLSMRASAGVMCASMVSPLRPYEATALEIGLSSAMPPLAKA